MTNDQTMKLEVLTPDSSRWNSFADQLESRLSECGCDGDTGDHVHRCAKAVMHKMGGINIEASLAYFEDHGGYCDCEILLNVDPDARIFRQPRIGAGRGAKS